MQQESLVQQDTTSVTQQIQESMTCTYSFQNPANVLIVKVDENKT